MAVQFQIVLPFERIISGHSAKSASYSAWGRTAWTSVKNVKAHRAQKREARRRARANVGGSRVCNDIPVCERKYGGRTRREGFRKRCKTFIIAQERTRFRRRSGRASYRAVPTE